MAEARIPPAPPGSGPAGRKLWRSVLGSFELDEHERRLLVEACRTSDLCEQLQGVVDVEGPMTTTRLGEVKTHPAVVELRNQRILVARLIVALRVPLGADEEHPSKTSPVRRAPRRAVRGMYGVRGGAA